jgi:hypothetical protein
MRLSTKGGGGLISVIKFLFYLVDAAPQFLMRVKDEHIFVGRQLAFIVFAEDSDRFDRVFHDVKLVVNF